jgi:hypothetical protein
MGKFRERREEGKKLSGTIQANSPEGAPFLLAQVFFCLLTKQPEKDHH